MGHPKWSLPMQINALTWTGFVKWNSLLSSWHLMDVSQSLTALRIIGIGDRNLSLFHPMLKQLSILVEFHQLRVWNTEAYDHISVLIRSLLYGEKTTSRQKWMDSDQSQEAVWSQVQKLECDPLAICVRVTWNTFKKHRFLHSLWYNPLRRPRTVF